MLYKIKNILIYNLNRSTRSCENNISMEKLKDMEDRAYIIIDVRSPQEYREGHIENAILIPEYELKNRAKKELKDLERPIIVYCSTGHRSKRAQKILKQMGYTEIYNLENGWKNY